MAQQKRPLLERIRDKEIFPILPPRHTTEEVMEELREVTLQYTMCADPIESAAQRQRALQGDAKGLMQKTAAAIIETANAATSGTLPRTTTVLDEDPTSVEHSIAAATEPPQPSRKRGRPTKFKDLRIKPKVFRGSSSRKGNLTNLTLRNASPRQLQVSLITNNDRSYTPIEVIHQ